MWVVLVGVTTASGIDIQVEVQNDDPVDIILCAGQTELDLNDFATRLKLELVKAGVEESRINIYATEQKSYTSTDDGLNLMKDTWTKFPTYARSAYLNSQGWLRGPDIGYSNLDDGLGSGYVDLVDQESSGFASAELDFAGWCSYCPAGVSSRVHTYNNNSYIWVKMFVASLEGNSPNCRPVLYLVEAPLEHIYYWVSQRGFSTSKQATKVAEGSWFNSKFFDRYGRVDGEEIPISDPIKLKMESEGNRIYVYVNDELSIEYIDATGEVPTGTCMFICAYAVHTGIRSAAFTIGGVLPLIDAARAPQWSSGGSNRFYVDVCDQPREDLEWNNQVGEIIQRMNADGAYYIGWGTGNSRGSIQQLINKLDSRGVYLESRDPNVYVNTARWIEPIVNKRISGDGEIYLIKDKVYSFTTKEA